MGEKVKIKLDDKEKARRKELDLPVTKELRYMHKQDVNWLEEKVISYQVVDMYYPSGTKSLMITLENKEKIRILHPYFAHMQKPSFVEDMQKEVAGNSDAE